MDERLCCVWLSLKESFSPEQICKLMKYYGSAEAVYRAASYERAGLSGKKALAELSDKSMERAKAVVKRMADLGGRIIIAEDEEYPMLLKEIYAPPVALYALGNRLPSEKQLTIAVVGTRSYDDYGRKAARQISRGLAERGAIIVSGMAEGADSFAAEEALRAGSSTIAVLGSGVDVVYPYSNYVLYEEIRQRGTILSEYAPGTRPFGYHFPQRNRIIAGLSYGTLVVQAPLKSGALITARDALENNRDVFAVPGSIFSSLQTGSNMLIKEGAMPVGSAEEILVCYEERAFELHTDLAKTTNIKTEKRNRLAELDLSALNETAVRIVKMLNERGAHADVIARSLQMESSSAETELMLLEIGGIVKKNSENIYELV